MVLATALFYKIEKFYTFDGNGRRKGIIDLDKKIGDPPLRITEPDFGEGTLFSGLDDRGYSLSFSNDSGTYTLFRGISPL